MKISNYKLQINKGFTLIELILYLALLLIIMGTLIPFSWSVIEGGVKSGVQQEVYDNGRYVSERIKYEIRNATGLNSVSATSISLSETVSAVNPTVITLTAGKVTIQQGVSAAVNLNSNDTNVSSLTFTNFTSGVITKNVQVVFTIGSNLPQTRQEYKGTVTFETAAEIRSN